MDMHHFSLGHIADRKALCSDALSPLQVFQTGQGFIVMETLPQRAPDSGVGIVAERVRLAKLGALRIPMEKYLSFGEFIKPAQRAVCRR